MTLPATPTWVNESGISGSYRIGKLSWQAIGDFDSGFGVVIGDMDDGNVTAWTQEA